MHKKQLATAVALGISPIAPEPTIKEKKMTKQETIEELYGELEKVRNFLMGMSFDPRLNAEIKSALSEKLSNLDECLNKHEDSLYD